MTNQPPLAFMADAAPMATISSQSNTHQKDYFPTMLAEFEGSCFIDLSCANVIAIPNARHKMVKRQRKTEPTLLKLGLQDTPLYRKLRNGSPKNS